MGAIGFTPKKFIKQPVSIPAMGAIGKGDKNMTKFEVSIPAMGGNSEIDVIQSFKLYINPRNGGQ